MKYANAKLNVSLHSMMERFLYKSFFSFSYIIFPFPARRIHSIQVYLFNVFSASWFSVRLFRCYSFHWLLCTPEQWTCFDKGETFVFICFFFWFHSTFSNNTYHVCFPYFHSMVKLYWAQKYYYSWIRSFPLCFQSISGWKLISGFVWIY